LTEIGLYRHFSIHRGDNNIIKKSIHMRSHREKILKYVKNERVVSSSDVAKFLKVSWNTADSYLKDLVIEGKIERIKKEGMTLWLLK
jgi:Mn-dependent DtxR family transcriptional regulator